MNTMSKACALLLGAFLATGFAGCKNRAEDTVPAPVTTPNTTTPSVTPTTPPSDTTTPAPDTTTTPGTGSGATGTSGTSGTGGTTGTSGTDTGATSGTSGTQGTTGTGQGTSTVPDRTDNKDSQRDRRPTY
jgi:hypothetical protein